MRKSILAFASVLMLSLSGGVTLADTQAVARVPAGGGFTAPVGFQIFCLQNSSFCRGGGASQVVLDRAAVDALKSVNAQVNRAIRPAADRGDVWQLGVNRGDCEDYVLAKRAELMRRGFPASALRIAAVRTRQGEGHAVLVVRTDQGDLVLDNLTSQLKFSNTTGLTFVAMTAADGRTWKRTR